MDGKKNIYLYFYCYELCDRFVKKTSPLAPRGISVRADIFFNDGIHDLVGACVFDDDSFVLFESIIFLTTTSRDFITFPTDKLSSDSFSVFPFNRVVCSCRGFTVLGKRSAMFR